MMSPAKAAPAGDPIRVAALSDLASRSIPALKKLCCEGTRLHIRFGAASVFCTLLASGFRGNWDVVTAAVTVASDYVDSFADTRPYLVECGCETASDWSLDLTNHIGVPPLYVVDECMRCITEVFRIAGCYPLPTEDTCRVVMQAMFGDPRRELQAFGNQHGAYLRSDSEFRGLLNVYIHCHLQTRVF